MYVCIYHDNIYHDNMYEYHVMYEYHIMYEYMYHAMYEYVHHAMSCIKYHHDYHDISCLFPLSFTHSSPSAA